MREKIVSWIRKQIKQARAKGVVLGLSGGVDSAIAAVLCKEALGKNRVLCLILPCESQRQDLLDANLIVKKFKLKAKSVDLKNIYNAYLKALPNAGRIARANLKSRLRMVILYYFANEFNYLVCGTSNKSEIMTGYFCYDANTRAVTKDGLKTYKELKPGDVVFSIDPVTGHVIEVPVREKYIFNYKGKMMSYGGKRNSRIDLMVTPNHRILIDKKGLQFCRVDLFPRRAIPTPVPGPWKGIQDPPPLFEFDNKEMGVNARHFPPIPIEDFLYVLGLYLGDGHAQLCSVRQLVKEGENSTRRRDTKTGRFLHKDIPATPKEYAAYRTWFALPDKSAARERLIYILKKNNIIYGVTPNQVWVYGKPFYRVMKKCGSSAHAKSIPPDILNYPAKYLRILVEGLMDSDGTQGKRYYTVSRRLAEQVVELGCKLGGSVSLRSYPQRISTRRDGVNICSSKNYEVSIHGNGRHWLNGAKFRQVEYSGKVWCPDVPRAHNFLIERNGHFIFCGNTKYGDGASDFLPLGGLFKTQVRQLAKVLDIPSRIIEKAPTAGLWPNQTDEAELGISYNQLDDILLRLQRGQRQLQTSRLVKKIKTYLRNSEHKRRLPPFCKI